MAKQLTESIRKKCRRAALAAADWYVHSQCVVREPFTDANVGRFVYNYYMPKRAKMWALSWTQARGIFVCLNAYHLTGDEKYSTAIQRAGLYLKALQKTDPREPQFVGAIPEAVPVEHFCYPRDTMEAAEAMVLLYRMTRDPDWLERARLTGDWFTNYVLGEDGWPAGSCFFDTKTFGKMRGCWQIGSAKYFYQMYRVDRDVKAFERSVRPMCDITIQELQHPDGSMIPYIPTRTRPDHHSGDKSELDVCYNDDGAGVALLMAHRVLKDKRYLDAAVALGDWMATRQAPFPSNVTVLNFANLLLDLHRLTKRSHYLEWVLTNLKCILDLQVKRSGDPDADGAFRGEDEPLGGYFGGKPEEYVNTRNTAYAALALFKLDGEAFGPGYSIYGWQSLPRLTDIIPDKFLIADGRR